MHIKNHKNTAYEFFYKNGPLAILPMKKKKKFLQVQLFGQINKNYLDNLKDIDNDKLIEILNIKLKIA